MKSKKLRADNKSGHEGVSWFKTRNQWRAYISLDEKQVFLGYFKNKNEAIAVRKQAEREYHGTR